MSDDQLSVNPILKKIQELSDQFLARAAYVDSSGPSNQFIRENLNQLTTIGYFGAVIAQEYGGLELPAAIRRECTELIASVCGATVFAQNQLHGGPSFIQHGTNDMLKAEKLPRFANGSERCGVAFSHLRRPGKPVCIASKGTDGYVINGVAPWVSDWSMMDSYVLGAVDVESEEMLFLYVNISASDAHIKASEPMTLAVMTACDTVSIEYDSLFVPEAHVISKSDLNHMKRSDFGGITGHVTLPLGCARGSASYLATIDREDAKEASLRIQNEIAKCRAEAEYWSGAHSELPDYKENALRVRAESISIALRAAETSIAASGGKAHLITHPAQRRLREAGFYATMAQTADTQAALMEVFAHA